ncbi:flagellar hook-associated protein FlgK [Cryobacterium sp. TMT1-2-2]|uniref:flagellar hook-associated protein FlgK n=1 Tax=Cryobacterium sp. TMT1-2-2 TaxID=1259233 RepID=UPI00106C0BD4|nr:flagellar hook-associated protein FlgK [Cryobacterium sp. TMT1-2-2]TFD12762.1 flagellar hook-associated protein FlgK [Cryobacterium sp. TMT1-2-2]
MSTFGSLNTAYTGLVAARQGLDVVGQNIANANTEGYTRQRISTSALGATAPTGIFTQGARVGEGVAMDGIARLASAQLDARVRATAATAGYTAVRANALASVEDSLNEPGEDGISAKLDEFWAGWQTLSNGTDTAAPAALLLGTAGELLTQISEGYQAVSDEWSNVRSDLNNMVSELNGAATQVAALNVQIRQSRATGGTANELLDQRSALTTTIAALTGATVTEQADGTVTVLVGGNALVSGGTAHQVQVTADSPRVMQDSGDVRLVWADNADTAVTMERGEMAGALSLLGGANASGTGGVLAEAASSYNTFASEFATKVNAIYATGFTQAGDTNLEFFTRASGAPAAQGLSIVPKSSAEMAVRASATSGAYDGTIADAIAQLGAGFATDVDGAITSPSTTWSDFVTKSGVLTQTELQSAALASSTASGAANQQLANSSVDLDEENVNLLMFQHAYQGAARMMTAVDEMLDTLINRTGLVGR